MEMKYTGYSVKKLIEETLKEGFKEESYREAHPSIRKFTKWANGIAYKLRWIEIPRGPLLIPAYPEEERKLAEKKQEEEIKRLELETEAKRGINWDETIIEYNDEKFDKILQELQKLCNEVRKKERDAEERWKRVKDGIWDKVRNRLKAKHISSKELKEIEVEKNVPVYLHYGLDVRWKDPVCGKMAEEIEVMKETFYKKYQDFITSITLDTFSRNETLVTFKGRFEHSKFIIGGCRSMKKLDNLLRFVKLYKIAFGCELERGRVGRPEKVEDKIWKEAIEYYYSLKYLCSEACKMEKQIKEKYEEKYGSTLNSINNTDKQKIAKELSKIMKEKEIKGITLGTLDDIEEMATKSPEHTALEKVSREYGISQSYFEYNRDFKEALHHHLFVGYRRGRLYRTLYKGK